MDQINKYISKYSEYLEEIRSRLYKVVIVFIVFFGIGFFFTAPFLKFFIGFLKIKNVVITTTSPFQMIDLAMSVGIFFAMIVTLPVFIYQTYLFLRSGLLKSEKKFFFILMPISLILFIVGFVYGFITLYYALKLIAEVNVNMGIVNLWDISRFMSQMIITSALLGIIFQFPILVTFLVRINILNIDFLRSKRRHAFVMIFIFVALLPPTDGLSLLVMTLPLIFIYEATILANSILFMKSSFIAKPI